MESVKSTVLVFEKHGNVVHQFCTEQDARAQLLLIVQEKRGGVALICDGMDAEMVYSISQNFRERGELAKEKIRNDLRIEAALDRHGVTKDAQTRLAVMRAVRDLMGSGLADELGPTEPDQASHAVH